MKHQKAIFNQVGSLEDIEIIEAETELLVSGEIRVEMLRAPIRHADLNLIAGNYGEKVNFPFTPGGEGVGRVIESLHPEF